MNPTAPPPDAAEQRLAESFDKLSRDFAANGGGDRLSALLASLINLIIAALRSITWNFPPAPAPGEADASSSSSTPQQQPASVRPKAPPGPRPHSPRPQTSKRENLPVSRVGKAPGSHSGPRPERSPD